VPQDAPRDELDAIWERVLEAVREGLPPATFDLWISPLRPVSAQAGALYVSAPATTRAWVERRYAASIQTALRDSGTPLERVVIVAEGTPGAGALEHSEGVRSLPLDPQHTFERFVIGDGNRLAHAAALAVAELPGEAYNPLFLHGPPGLGKTHLLGAVVDYLDRRRPDLTVHYTTAERFTTEFVTALRKDGPERFKQRYRQLDALLIDDVQALEGKEYTQEEFVNTFNALHASGKQIVLSSDRPPEALSRLAERLRDRFQWGLTIELGSPDLRTRTALLWRMTMEGALDLPEPTVLREIASLAAGNVRRLEGAMTRVAALSSMLSEPMTSSLVRRALTRPSGGGGATEPHSAVPAAPSIPTIQDAACSVMGVSREDLLSAKRTRRVVEARQLAIYLSRELTSLSLAQIAREFNRDHSTVLHSIRNFAARLEPASEAALILHRTRALLGTDVQAAADTRPRAHRAHHLPPFASTTRSSTEAPSQ
jgi:chromosomal replication initiator protein